ncbi:MAG: T9SS type A sorting domain-containing protein [Saprospiraceae bacterium]|nr:T9SS type A sorting domain-containing protein [Saprospiraceae bacterium]MDW8485208.1 T9SS type A sorting domain-containing protein [Saprospiraceae bacterium]
MRKFLAALVFTDMAATLAPAQIFWTETFDDSFQAASHWVHGGVNAGPSQWEWTANPADGYQEPGLVPFAAPTAKKGYFLFNSDANGPSRHDVWLTNLNRPVDCSYRVGVRLRFYTQYIYFSPSGTRAQLGVSTDGSNFEYIVLFDGHPANLPFEGWMEVELPQADNAPQVWLRFRWIGQYEYHWKIDDLALVSSLPQNPDFCHTALDISELFRKPAGEVQISPVVDNTYATTTQMDPVVSCWEETPQGEPDFLDNTLWFAFTGTGHRYDIQTVPCSAQNYVGTAQGLLGDTQIALFEGDNCNALKLIACNDDRSPIGDPDWRAGLVIPTTAGQRYFLMVDGHRGPSGAAQGEFCLQVMCLRELPCHKGSVGRVSVSLDGLVCFKSYLNYYIKLDTTSFSLPTEGEVFGMAWCLSSQPIPDSVWPGDLPGIISTVFSPTLSIPVLVNDGSFFPFGTYYLTPVVVGNGLLKGPGPAFVFNVRLDTGGCFFVGASQRLVLLPPLEPLDATLVVTHETVPPGKNGSVQVIATGGSGQYLNTPTLYEYYWSHGPRTPILSQLSHGIYTVTIADFASCVPGIKRVAVVQQIVNTAEPAANLLLNVFPNPTAQGVWVQAALPPGVSEGWVQILSPLGQVLLSRHIQSSSQMDEYFDVHTLAPGLYVVRLIVDNLSTIQRFFIKQY